MFIPCPYRVIKTLKITKRRTFNQTYYWLPAHVEQQVLLLVGYKIVSNEPCPGHLLIELVHDYYSDDDNSLELGWYCSSVKLIKTSWPARVERRCHGVNLGDHPMPLQFDDLGEFINSQLGYNKDETQVRESMNFWEHVKI